MTKYKRWFRILSDLEIKKAAKLHGLKFQDGFLPGYELVFDVIPKSFGGHLIKYWQEKNSFGKFGRWMVQVNHC